MSGQDRIPEGPAYRRKIAVRPRPRSVVAMLEDDLHCMAVILRHDGIAVQRIEPMMERVPWDTCPGALAKLVETFEGLPLGEVDPRREKKQNCTHLHDLAVLAAAHALDECGFVYDVVATDPDADSQRTLVISRDGEVLHSWIERDGILVAPGAVAGLTLLTMRNWIGGLSGTSQEAARLLQWGSLVAHGRTMPIEQQSRAADLPPNCYSFQPERARHANRIGLTRDFAFGSEPLAMFRTAVLERLDAD